MSVPVVPLSHARSYLYFRLFVGAVGIVFPLALLAVHGVTERTILDSISDYGYSCAVGNFFVGGLFALGILLVSYPYERVDNVICKMAGVSAMLAAILPKDPDLKHNAYCNPAPLAYQTFGQPLVGYLHYFFSAAALVLLAIIVLFFFTRPAAPFEVSRTNVSRLFSRKARSRPLSGKLKDRTKRKLQRNQIYEICGVIMAICLVLLGLQAVSWVSLPSIIHPVYWLETLTMVGFGVAWIIKGELILKDEGTGPDRVQRIVRKVIPRRVAPFKN